MGRIMTCLLAALRGRAVVKSGFRNRFEKAWQEWQNDHPDWASPDFEKTVASADNKRQKTAPTASGEASGREAASGTAAPAADTGSGTAAAAAAEAADGIDGQPLEDRRWEVFGFASPRAGVGRGPRGPTEPPNGETKLKRTPIGA